MRFASNRSWRTTWSSTIFVVDAGGDLGHEDDQASVAATACHQDLALVGNDLLRTTERVIRVGT